MTFTRGVSLCVSLVLLAFARPLVAQAGSPLGPEFLVNTYTTNRQARPRVASDSSGNLVVVWMSDTQDGASWGIFGQRYASSGAPVGAEFRVNAYTTSAQKFPTVASDSSGNFVVVWQSSTQDGSLYGVFGQRYASSGAPAGGEFIVNSFATNDQESPSVASDSSGNFVVVWQSTAQDGFGYGIFGQRYASSGASAGAEFRVNSYTTNNQQSPAVASDPSGGFVVVWNSDQQDGSSSGVFGQRYASSGALLGAEFRVNTYTTSVQGAPSVASDSSGNFIVVWGSFAQDGSNYGIFGQRYASSGAPAGAEFMVDSFTTNSQQVPSVASDASGNFVVVWSSYNQDGWYYGVFGQRYSSSGAPAGAEFRINSYTPNDQQFPSAASDSSGNFVVVWHSYRQDGSNFGAFGQRYGKILPVELTRFTAE